MTTLALVTDAWDPQVNGVVTTLHQMIRLAPNNWDIRIIHPGLFKTIPTPSYPEIRTVINPWQISKYLDNIDSLHIATEGSLGIAARIIAGKRKWAYTTGFHTNFPEYLQLRTKIPAKVFVPFVRWFHANSKAIMVPSNSTKEKLISWRFKNLVTWGRGYDEAIFHPHYERSKSDKIRLLYVGRVSIEKNIGDLLNLSKKDCYEVSIVGDGPQRAKLEAHYPKARFLGYKRGQELAQIYAQSDVFVFPSCTDTFGVVMIEAMACGAPVAAYPVEGPMDVISQDLGGCLDNDLEKAIERAITLPREGVIANAAPHSWKRSADTFYSHLTNLAGRYI